MQKKLEVSDKAELVGKRKKIVNKIVDEKEYKINRDKTINT